MNIKKKIAKGVLITIMAIIPIALLTMFAIVIGIQFFFVGIGVALSILVFALAFYSSISLVVSEQNNSRERILSLIFLAILIGEVFIFATIQVYSDSGIMGVYGIAVPMAISGIFWWAVDELRDANENN
tara:strand:- start:2667 stop:3053 length:387 start_codon:yes stop_codon:yes gene_type:complete